MPVKVQIDRLDLIHCRSGVARGCLGAWSGCRGPFARRKKSLGESIDDRAASVKNNRQEHERRKNYYTFPDRKQNKFHLYV